jgi:hypothetical protein
MQDSEYEKHDNITESTLKPVTKTKSKLDRNCRNGKSNPLKKDKTPKEVR